MTANLHEQRGMYRVMLSWYQNSKRMQKNVATGIPVQGNNKREAEAARKRILREWEDKVTVNFQDILFSDYLKQWLEDIKGSIEPTTHADYRKTVENIICPYFAERKIKLQDVKPYHIKDFYRQRMKDIGVSANTIHHYHANIRKALNDAVDGEIIKENPASKVKLPQKERFTSDFYTADELRLLLDKAIGEKIETPIVLAAWLGLRRGEILGLRWQDIDLHRKTLYVCGVVTDKGTGSRTENLAYRDSPKTQSSIRLLSFSQQVADYLILLKKKQEENRMLAGDSYCTKWDGFVCVNEIGNLIKPEYLSRAFRLFLKKHRLRHIRFHELRTSNASLLCDKGVDMKRIQSWLGHSNYNTTANLYAHLRKGYTHELSEVLGKELSND